MKYRKLRIAWSVFWGLAAVLLIVLWARSYSCSDGFEGSLNGWYFEGASESGQLWAGAYGEWRVDALPVTAVKRVVVFGIDYGSYGAVAFVPHWCAATAAIVLAAIPWLSTRFSLRTLLLATTLVAALLGMVVWLS